MAEAAPTLKYLKYEDQDGRGPWLIVLHLAPIDGRMECIGFEMLAYSPDSERQAPYLPDSPGAAEPLTATTLRHVALGGLVKEALSQIEVDPPIGLSEERERDLVEAAKKSRAGRGGAKGHPVEHYMEVAKVYAEALARGDKPTTAVMEREDWPHAYDGPVPKATAAKWVARAREFGFLKKTSRGVPGGMAVSGKEPLRPGLAFPKGKVSESEPPTISYPSGSEDNEGEES